MDSPMDDTAGHNSHLPPSLRTARRLLFAVFLICLLLAGGMSTDRFVRSGDPVDAAAWMRRLDLSMPALWPAGTLLRAPETASPAVLPRLGPHDCDPWDETCIATAWQLCPRQKVTP